MGRKKIMTKFLTCFAAATTIVTGILGSIPLPVRAAEEGSYTVTFEAYEGTCETESVSVPKGESIILPDASYEGHYLESWVDVTESGDVTKFTAVGRSGDTYTPERDLWLYANWKPEQDITVTYEARIGDIQYEKLEEAFANAQAGDTIIVLKDCSVSRTLEVTADNITLKSEDAENPVTIRREEEFAGKKYAKDAGNVLVGISSGSLAMQDIILDGGAVLDKDFNNTGQIWDSELRILFIFIVFLKNLVKHPVDSWGTPILKQQIELIEVKGIIEDREKIELQPSGICWTLHEEFFKVTTLQNFWVLEWTDNRSYASNYCFEDVDPMPYDISEEEILEHVDGVLRR